MTLRKSIFSIFLLQINILFSQDISFRHLSAENGLSQNTINCIYQDQYGFMWFGTQDGLNLFDGYKIKVFRHDPSDSTTLSHNWIWDIAEDDSLNLWIATWNGLSKFDRRTRSFGSYFPDPEDDGSISGSRPASIVNDTSGRLWIGTWGGGLNFYDPETGLFTAFRASINDDNRYPGDFIRKLFTDSRGAIWVGTWNGLWRCKTLPDGSFEFDHYSHDPMDPNSISSNRITAFEEDGDGMVWIGTLGGGVNRYDHVSDRFTRFLHQNGEAGTISNNDITSIKHDLDGKLWVGTVSGGLNRLDPASLSFETYHHNPADAGSISSEAVYSIYLDRSGLLWIGAGGLNIYDRKLSRFNCPGSLMDLREALSKKSVNAIFEDKAGNLWVGTQNSGLFRLNTKDNTIRRLTDDRGEPVSLDRYDISDIAEDPEGNIWISTRGGGLVKINGLDQRIVRFNERPDMPETRGFNYISQIAFDSKGILWIATSDNGLIRFDPATLKYHKFMTDPADQSTLSGNYLFRIVADSRDNLWIGTWGAGLNHYDNKSGTFIRYLNDPSDPHSIPGNIIHSIYECMNDSARAIWIGTESGLARFYPEYPELGFESFSLNNRLPSPSVYGTLMDDNNNLWVSSNAGLTRINIGNQTLKHFNKRNGLPGNEFNGGAFLELKEGLFAFGCINGLLIFQPDSIIESNYQPETALTSFSVFNEEIYDGVQLNTMNSIILTYKQNFFSFEFASMDYSDPEKNMFMYRLEGIDDGWVHAGNRHFASYTNIDPGVYGLLIKGTNSDGIWSGYETSLDIIITPPFWQKWWFRIGTMVAAILLLLSLHFYRVNRIREIERLRIRIASDLHDDVGSALTRISVHTQQIQTGEDTGAIRKASRQIGELSREVISTMSDIVWSIDARNDRIADLLDRMQDFAYSALSEKEIRVLFEHHGLEGKKVLPVLIRQNLYYIYKEAINNIVKHSDAGSVSIILSNAGPEFKMIISDNGNGYDPVNIRKGNGLRNMHMRAERIGARMDITAEQGVKIQLQMKNI